MMSPTESKKPWYHEGLPFACQGCGGCCTGEPGYVWVEPEEIFALARRLKIDLAEFEQKYVRREGRRLSLCEHSNGDCVFYDNEKTCCTVYEDRPRQCRTWPFWASNLRTPEDWEQTCRECPGAGTGPTVSLEEIQRRRGVIQI